MKYKFEIYRSSDILGKKRPCTNAILTEVEGIPKWFISIRTLEDLIELYNEVGYFIFDVDSIEIYDDYRE